MIEDVTVVQSAISAFNNAALWAPAFLWWTILAMPMFVVVYWFSEQIMQKLGWEHKNVLGRVTIWTAGLTLLWVVMFGGNYAVLRNTVSVLPFMVALIVFLAALFVSSHLRNYTLPRDWRKIVFICALLVALGLSDVHAWWGPLLQIGAFVLGVILGRVARSEMRPVAGTLLIVMVTTVAILMQPEFFRFGQLGNLTVFHLLAVLVLGITAVATVVLFNVKPANRVRFTAFIKMKWLLRVVCALAAALFVLTEAVPVFIGALAAVFLLFALSVRHAKVLDVALGHRMFALLLMLFGMITVMPVITIMGILYWNVFPMQGFWRNFRGLL